MNVIVPLADGFEEIEATAIIDVLRRADIEVTTAFLNGNPVMGAHGIAITADKDIRNISPDKYGCIILPGGMPGSKNLMDNGKVNALLKAINLKGGIIAAICAAPMALGHAGLLKGKKATCYPGMEDEMTGAVAQGDPVVIDGNIITGRGPACAIPFALEIVAALKSEERKNRLKEALQVYWM